MKNYIQRLIEIELNKKKLAIKSIADNILSRTKNQLESIIREEFGRESEELEFNYDQIQEKAKIRFQSQLSSFESFKYQALEYMANNYFKKNQPYHQ